MNAPRPGVLLVHGLGGTAQSMAPLVQALATNGVPSTALTLPGHGTSSDELVGVTWNDWRAAVERAVADVDRGTGVVVVGQSMGGALALHAAADGPARPLVRAVIAINAPVPDADAVDGIEWRISHGHTYVEAIVADGECGYSKLPMDAVLAMVRGLLEIDLINVTVPVVVVNGALDDTVDPTSGEALIDALTGVPAVLLQRAVLAHTGHVATFGPEVDTLAELVIGLADTTAGDPPLT